MILYILALMMLLAPGRTHDPLALGISNAIKAEGCLYSGADCERHSAALAVAIAFRESSFHVDAEGDCDRQTPEEIRQGVPKRNCRSMCAFQVWRGSRTLLTDPQACALAGYRRIKESLTRCRGSLSGYATGVCGSVRGEKISDDRKGLAGRIFDKAVHE